MVRLRVYHPLIAIGTALYVLILARYISENPSSANAKKLAQLLLVAFVAQLIIGGINLILLVPVWTQMINLAMADTVWIVLVLLLATLQAQPMPEAEPEPG